MMNLTQLKYFYAICEYKTISRAAEHLYITQPSLSNAIKELEREFGVTLFIRRYKGIELTKEGETLFKMGKELLTQFEHTEHLMKEMGKERKILRLGIPPMIGSLILPDIYNNFLKKNYDIKIDITEGGQHELESMLNEELLDMIFMPHNDIIKTKFSSVMVGKLEIVCCTAENSYIDKKTVSPHDLSKTPLVLFKNSFFQTDEIKKWFRACEEEPNILLQTAQVSTVKSIIKNNVAAGFLFRQLASEEKNICILPLDKDLYANISLVWRKDCYFSESMSVFLEYIKNSRTIFEANSRA